MTLTKEQLNEARMWIDDCDDLRPGYEAAPLTDEQVEQTIQTRYYGGVGQFVADSIEREYGSDVPWRGRAIPIRI